MSALADCFPSAGWKISGGFAIPYAFGMGQLLAIPGSAISAVAAGIFGSTGLFYYCRMKVTDNPFRAIEFNKKRISQKNHALNSFAATAFFIAGGVPVIGGPLGVFCAYKIYKLHTKNSEGKYH